MGYSSAPYLQVQFPAANISPEARDLPSAQSSGQYHSSHITMPAPLTSLRLVPQAFAVSHHPKKGEYSTMRYFEKKGDHIHLTLLCIFL